ncbi:MAG: mercuric transporter MerT family protein [Pseudomonadota bacterium]|nr:mercuric transporter MerT family protein [Pseudomonadota bacterium]
MASENSLIRQAAAETRRTHRAAGKTLVSIGGILAAIAASSCCVLPLGLFALGISGAWISNLTALAPYQPYFVAVTLACLVAGFAMVYRTPKAACLPGSSCARPGFDRFAKLSLWTATVIITAALAFPYVAPLFIET